MNLTTLRRRARDAEPAVRARLVKLIRHHRQEVGPLERLSTVELLRLAEECVPDAANSDDIDALLKHEPKYMTNVVFFRPKRITNIFDLIPTGLALRYARDLEVRHWLRETWRRWRALT